jgi:alginate O-acetyltransferase complex protein AlgI
MWFLDFKILLAVAAACFLMLAVNLPALKIPACIRRVSLAVLSLLLMAWIDWKPAVFYAVYTVLLYALLAWISAAKRGKKILSLFTVFVCLTPLVLVRLYDISRFIVLIGIAFAVLRGIDAVYYAYFTGERVRFVTFVNFMLFFPVFIIGPVFRYRDFARQLHDLQPVSIEVFTLAVKRIIRGLFQKIVLVQFIAMVFNHYIEKATGYTLPVSFLMIVCSYAMLYFDLAGYSDIAIAFGRLCGFTVPENFKKPWRAASFTQFWRGWHATVSDWIREHVYILLKNKQLNKWMSALAAVAIMVVMAMWHGFYASFLIVGLYNGLLLGAENLLGLTSPKKNKPAVKVIRAFAVNFLFAINTLVFFTGLGTAVNITAGLFRL